MVHCWPLAFCALTSVASAPLILRRMRFTALATLLFLTPMATSFRVLHRRLFQESSLESMPLGTCFRLGYPTPGPVRCERTLPSLGELSVRSALASADNSVP